MTEFQFRDEIKELRKQKEELFAPLYGKKKLAVLSNNPSCFTEGIEAELLKVSDEFNKKTEIFFSDRNYEFDEYETRNSEKYLDDMKKLLLKLKNIVENINWDNLN